MIRKNNHTVTLFFIFLSILLYIASLLLLTSDTIYFANRWLVFWIYIFSVSILFGVYLQKTVSKQLLKKIITGKELNPILLLSVIVINVNFLLLSIYPYISISDELRDGGLFPMQIASGMMRNIFSYGAYDAYGLIIPTLTIPFYYLFGNSTLSYRVPAAVLSSADVLLLYILVRSYINKDIALWAAIILATMPLHIFFAHTQIVVGFNFIWVPIILLVFFRLLKKHTKIDYIFLGTVLGFAAGFHAAIRAFVLLVFFLLIFLDIRVLVLNKIRSLKTVKQQVIKMVLLIFFIFLGFGPRILYTAPHQFFHTSRFVLEKNIETNKLPTINDITIIKNNYVTSLMVYIYSPTTFFYPDYKPLYPFFLSIFFVLGVGYSFFILKNFYINILLFFLVAMPFTNSAITDSVNADQRLSPLFAISSVFVGIGIFFCISLIKIKWIKYIFGGLIAVYLILQVTLFYIYQPANKNRGYQNYLAMHTIYFLQNEKQYKNTPSIYLHDMAIRNKLPSVCLYVSENNYSYFTGASIGAFKEQNQFLLPDITIHYKEEKNIYDNEVYIQNGNCSNTNGYKTVKHIYVISCSVGNNFSCPVGYKGDFILRY